MKPVRSTNSEQNFRSPPMRGRGLKHAKIAGFFYVQKVAPHAGAWIETLAWAGTPKRAKVAPHAGAWIETHRHYSDCGD